MSASSAGLILYVKDNCAFSRAALAKVDELNIPVDIRNIKESRYAKELVHEGGYRQVPYLLDHNRHLGLYESAAIVEYLGEHYKT